MKIRIFHDVYNISQRIKNLDRYYFILFNTSKGKFEVHNSSQLDSTYCLTLPFNQLDERTLTYVYQTMSTNIEKILENIENENRQKESAEKSSALNQAYSLIEENIRR